MATMYEQGRLFYYRAIVLVGNGRGCYGIGVGFAPTPLDARKEASIKALQRLEFVDLDEGGAMTIPVWGKEYGQHVKVIPRPVSKGIHIRKKYLPWAYLVGLDNCKWRFWHRTTNNKWFSKTKAIRRCLEMVYSRKTMANATGMKYSSILAPGDSWVHWPDRWFDEVRQTYDARHREATQARIRGLGARNAKKHRGRVGSPLELRPGWTQHAWMNPLQKSLRKKIKAARTAYSCDPANVVNLRHSGVAGENHEDAIRAASSVLTSLVPTKVV